MNKYSTGDGDENSPLIGNRSSDCDKQNRVANSVKVPSTESALSDREMKTPGGFTATWSGRRRSLPEPGQMRQNHSWDGGIPDDVRIIRERLVRTQTRLRRGAVRLLTRRQRLTLASLALVDFMSFCSMSVMAPFFPSEATAKGLSNTTCGLIFSFYALVMFITSPVMGKLIPTVGAKFMFTAGMFLAGGCNVIFGSLVLVDDTTTFAALCFLVRGLEALGASAYSTASYVFVVQTFPDTIGSVLGILETFVGLGMSVGPTIGGLLYSIGGFGLPFYTLGIIMVFIVPVNYMLLMDCEDFVSGSKSSSVLSLFKIPSIIITGLVIIVVSHTWAFLDPTLEPHLRQFGLSTKQIALVFLLFSSLYGIFSPIWGWVADRMNNHWCMMVWGLFLSSFGLLLLGPCPFIPGRSPDLWLDLIALSILSISVALTLLPTFQAVLASSIYEGGRPEALVTYSAVAGVWSCCYSLGEVLGPAVGSALADRYGFPLSATISAAACLTMGVVALTFFSLRESAKGAYVSGSCGGSTTYSDSTWTSNHFCTCSATENELVEKSPLLTPTSISSKSFTQPNHTSTPTHICFKHKTSNKSGAASIAESLANILKFQYVTNILVALRKGYIYNRSCAESNILKTSLYQNYIENNEADNTERNENAYGSLTVNHNIPKINYFPGDESYCSYIETAIFGSQSEMKKVHKSHLIVKKNNKGLVSKVSKCNDEIRNTSEEIIKHNLEKVSFYEKSQPCTSLDDIFDACDCKDGVTFIRGTVTVSPTGACEV